MACAGPAGLGAEKAPVRLGGLHALERLAQKNPDQRQTIVAVICAYLRMPYTPPDGQAPGEDAPEDAHSRYEQRQELQVRLTAQRILSAHLKPAAAEVFWANIDLDLTEAHLHQLDLTVCRVRSVQFSRAEFAGGVGFDGAKFAGYATFGGAEFAGYARFDGAEFAGYATFGGAEFAGYARFDGAEFAGDAEFYGAKFAGYAGTRRSTRRSSPGPRGSTGRSSPGTRRSTGRSSPGIQGFMGHAWPRTPVPVVLPTGWTTRTAQPAEGEEEGWLYVVRDEDSSEQPAEAPSDGAA